MIGRASSASTLVVSVLALGFVGLAPEASAAERPSLKHRDAGQNYAVELKRRVRGRRILLPLGPGYIYYDYPYYYARGYYPTHIGGYVYYPYHYRRNYYTRQGGSPRHYGAYR